MDSLKKNIHTQNIWRANKFKELKALSIAVFAGCIALIPQAALADNAPTSTLEKLHTANSTIPDTDIVYPDSAYILTEVTAVESNQENVITYYDPNTLDDQIHYYRVDLKETELGSGTAEKYFKWSKDEYGVKLVETDNPESAVLTLKYTPGEDSLPPVIDSDNNVISVVDGIYVVKDIKRAIVASEKITDVSAKFAGNTITITADDSYDYSAIITEYGALISDVNSTFVGNKVTSTDSKTIYGTLVKSIGTIDRLYSEFIGNSLDAAANVNGGFVEASGTGKISEISSDFYLNRVVAHGNIEGAILGNDGTINTIRDSKFVNNYGISENGNVYGGAVFNNNLINSIKDTVFIGNYVKSLNNNAQGGAIHNKLSLNEISNTIFRDNFAESVSGSALGGAIYTYTDLKISANNGKSTEFTNNYIINNGVQENQAIYAATKDVSIVFNAYDRGRILLNDVINGVNGYKITLTGDETGKISLYNYIKNANVNIENVNIDTADGNYLDYNFLSLNSYDTAKYNIDINFTTGESDKFIAGNSSQGTIFISDLNIIGELPETDRLIQILQGPDTISIKLAKDLIEKYTSTKVSSTSIVNDTIAGETSWSKEYKKHIITEYLTTSIREASSDGRNTPDSIEVFGTISETDELTDWGDTLALVNREKDGTRKFIADKATETYTIKEDLGKTASGILTVEGVKEGNTLSTIDADGHTMFEIEEGAEVQLHNVNIVNQSEQDGSILNIKEGGKASLINAVNLNSQSANGIINDGQLIVQGEVNSDTGITGNGTYILEDGTYTTSSLISQNIISILENGILRINDSGTIYANSITNEGKIYSSADALLNEISNNGYIYLNGGTVKHQVSGTGQLWINGNVTFENLVTCPIYLNNIGGSLTTNADYIGTSIIKGNYFGPRILNLTGGTLSYTIDPTVVNITGNVTYKDGLTIYSEDGTFIKEGGALTANASAFRYGAITNDSILNLTGGTLTIAVKGKGDINIKGDVISNVSLAQTGENSTINILENAALKINSDNLNTKVENDGILRLTGGTLKKEVTGDGYINITGNTYARNVDVTQKVVINSGIWFDIIADKIKTEIETKGTLILRGGTLSQNVYGTGKIKIQDSTAVDIYTACNFTTDSNATLTINADYIGGGVTDNAGNVLLTGGTLAKNITGNGNVQINNDSSVINNAIIKANTVTLNNNASLTTNANNIVSSAYNVSNSNGNLYLTGGDINYRITGNGTTNITGNVNTTEHAISNNIYVADTGTLTSKAELLNGLINNEGNLNLSGELAKTIAGNGTTNINNTLDITDTAVIEGILNLNNGVLASNESYENYNIGTAINSGTLNFGIDFATQTNDKFILNNDSTGIFKISANSIKYNSNKLIENSDHTYRVLYGDSNAKLTWDGVNNGIDFKLEKEENDVLDRSDVYFDEDFFHYLIEGTLHADVEIVSTSGISDDSIRITTEEIVWGDRNNIRADLLKALNQYVTEEDRHFRFRTSNDEYITLENLDKTAEGKLTIHGVADNENRSSINLNEQLGFKIGENTELNLFDVELKNAKDNLILSSDSSIGSITVDEDGNETISGGIVNSVFTNNIKIDSSNSDTIGGTVIRDSKSIISQIKDSVFKENYLQKTNDDIYSTTAVSAYGGAMYLNGTQIGSKTTAQGGIINSVFEDNYISGNTARTNEAKGGAIYAINAFIAGIEDSIFKNNRVGGLGGSKFGGAIYLENSQIGLMDTLEGGIINSTFENNALSGNTTNRGAAIYSANSTISKIENSIFNNNQLNGSTNTVGAALSISESTIGSIINSTFSNNSVTSTNSSQGNGGAIRLLNSTISEIIDTTFSNNTSTYRSGAINIETSKINTISGTISFENESDNFDEKIASIKSTTAFENNSSKYTGGAITLVTSNSSIDNISGVLFKNNSVKANSDGYSGAIHIISNTNARIGSISNSYFIGNNVTGSKAYASAIHVGTSTSLDTITDSYFINNIATATTGLAEGGVINNLSTINRIANTAFIGNETYARTAVNGGTFANAGTINELSHVSFINNYANSSNSYVIGNFYNAHNKVINNAEYLTFKGNHILATNEVWSGGIFNLGNFKNGIVNSTFKDNYAITTSKTAALGGGAIYTSYYDLNIIAKDNFVSEFSGNYVMRQGDESTKVYRAIFVGSWDNKKPNLILTANTGGRLLFKDSIAGYNGYKTTLTGDGTGTISLYRSIFNSNITAQNVNIDTINDDFYAYDFKSLTSQDTAKYGIDIDFQSGEADTFTLNETSTGTILIDTLNVKNLSDKNSIVQILKVKAPENSNIQLALDSSKINTVENVLYTCTDIAYDSDIFHQNAGYSIATTETCNDSIAQFVETTYDTLNVIASSNLNTERTFKFKTDNVYTVTEDIKPVTEGIFSIRGIDDSTSIIDADNHSMLELSNATELNIYNTKITNAKDNNIINVSNEEASVNLTNAYIDGNITGSVHFALGINGENTTTITGKVTNADTVLKSGILSFSSDTFADQNDSLDIQAGRVVLSHDNTAKDYNINKLTSAKDAGYSIDFDLSNKTTDKLTISDTTSSGTVTIDNINFLNSLENYEDFTVQVLDTNGNENVQLALDKYITNYEIKDISREEQDEILSVTKYTDKFSAYIRNGKLCGEIYLATKATTNDSIAFEIKEIWETSREFDRYLGDTLTLVNKADLSERTFVSDQATDIYKLEDELGKTATGVLNLDGVTLGDNKSTIDLNRHKGFEIGKDTTLNINNTKITDRRNENTDIITVTDSSANINLNNAYIDGNIKGTEKFDLNIAGLYTTTINGTVKNANATLVRGGLSINTDTFADKNSTLIVESGLVNMGNNTIENYQITNLVSSDKSKFVVDVDLTTERIDTITTGAGASGLIVLNELNFTGGLSQIGLKDDYTLQIIKNTANTDIKLQLSESVLSQINKDIKLGTDHEIVSIDDVNPTSLWTDEYYIHERDLDIYGRIKLATKETTDDSLHLYNLSIVAGEMQHVLGDTLKLLNILETEQDRNFNFESASNVYNLKDYLGTTTEGKISINGIADQNDKTVTSTINMNYKTGFGVSNNSEVNISNIKFENINFKDGSLLNISNKDGVANLDNVYITDTICLNAISNAGTVNMTGGNVVLNTGVIGTGITNVTGADVVFGENQSITQQAVNVNAGSLTMADDGIINSSLTIGENGVVNIRTNSIINAVSNNGNINFRGGELLQNINGSGTTNIVGNVLNSAKINQNVNIKSGTLTSSAEQLGGGINNDSNLILNGTLSKNITGKGETVVNESIKLAQGAGIEGKFNLNDGNITTKDSLTSDYQIGEMTGNGSFTIDVDFAKAKADKFIVGNTSKGNVYIDNINYLNIDGINETLKVQVLETNGTNAIQLSLNEEISKVDYKVGRTERNEQDNILAVTNYKDIYNNYIRGGDVFGNLVLGTTNTINDSLVVKVDDSKTQWDKDRNVTDSMGDTLALWNQLDTKEDKSFVFDKVDTYKVSDNVTGIGETKGDNITVSGVSKDETTKAAINFNGKTGFELNNAQTLNINNTKLTGTNNLISVSNSDAIVNLNNAYIDGNITGTNNFSVNIAGDDVTTLNGIFTNTNTTLTSGGLKFNTDTFKTTSLNTIGGQVLLSNGKIENYVINNLTSDKNAIYTIDVNLAGAGSADTIHVTSGTGTILLDTLNIVGSIENFNTDYVIQILHTNNNDLQLALTDDAQSQLGEEHLIGKLTHIFEDEVKRVTNWKDIYNKYSREDLTYGKFTLTQTDTINDSLGITISKVIEGEKELIGPLGDTLRLVNNAENVLDKIFEFDSSKDTYKVSENLGQTKGKVTINGVSDNENSSTIDFDNHSGFELTEKSELNISNTILTNAEAEQGSVINAQNSDSKIKLTNVIITNNSSSAEHGSAINSNSDVEIIADSGNSIISGNNTSNDNEAVYMGENANLTLKSVNKGKLFFNDKINGQSTYLVTITGDKSGHIYLNDQIKNANVNIDTTTVHLSSDNHFASSRVNVDSGRIDLVNGLAQQQVASSFNVSGDFNLDVDVDLAKVVMDRLPANTTVQNGAFINVDNMNLLSDTTAKSIAIPFAYHQFKENVKYVGPEELSKDTQITAFAPIYKYSVKYESREDQGYFVFGQGAGANPSTSAAYNPSILASSVASQVGSYAAMNESWNYVFEHIDSYMTLPANQRLAVKHGNKYTINSTSAPLYGLSEYNRDAAWNRSYAVFENIGLKNGPKVNTVSYGTLIGGDGELKNLPHGWQTVTTAYAGYNGSSQYYNDVSTYQNGGLLGATQTFYKNNFFTAVTASAGASVGESNTMYGHEEFVNFMAGIASKTGFNLEFQEGRMIVQPSLLAAYTFINTFDYTNAAGVRIDSDPLHTIQIHPEVKFIANLKNGWQPYARVGMVWNLLNDTKVTANQVNLPQMSIRPYVEYGVGVQKHWADKFSGYLQAMIRNGGRNGVSLTAGFRWALGKDKVEKVHNTDKPHNVRVLKELKTPNRTSSL